MGIVHRLVNLHTLGLGRRLALITAVMLLLYAAMAPIAFWYGGALGVTAAGLSASVCLVGALGALVASDHFRGPSRALYAMACSMALRSGLPLVLATALLLQKGDLFKAGGVHYLLVFYLAALAVETPLSLPGTETNPPRPQGRAPRCVQSTPADRAGCPGGDLHDTIS
jgi:hypothetical protein